jgi:hypothetical protein
VIKDRKIAGMLLGTIIVVTATMIASEGLSVAILSSVLGLAIGGILGYLIKTTYENVAAQMSEMERASLRALLMIKSFNEVRSKYSKDIMLFLLQKIMFEGKQLMLLQSARHPAIKE